MKITKFERKLSNLVEEAEEDATNRPGKSDATVAQLATSLMIESHRLVPPAPAPATNVEMEAALRKAGQQFLHYEENHILKRTLEGDRKAQVNRDMAIMCFTAIGEADTIPERPSVERKPGLDGWRDEVQAESAQEAAREPQEHDSAPPADLTASTDPRALLRGIYEAVESEKPLLGSHFQPDARIALNVLAAMGFATVDEVSDKLGITTSGREALGIRPAGVIDLPVEVAEVTGNISESELAARYMEGKIAAIDKAIALRQAPQYEMQCSWEESYQHAALAFRAAADEFRAGLHLPTVQLEGRVIPYNEDRSSGMSHSSALALFFTDVYGRNLKAGWWTDISTGQPKKRNVGELFMLMVTELAEAYDGYLTREPDDKLPEYPGLGVEMGDLLIRVADFCGALAAGNIVEHTSTRNPGDEMFGEVVEIARRYESIRKTPEAVGDPEAGELLPAQDVAVMVDAKLAFNAKREDHKIENRLKEDGKRT